MNSFNSIVSSRFSIYNSLFLNLPFQNISKTGNFLPLLQLVVEQGYEAGLSPDEIITKFFEDYSPDSQEKEKFDFLFRVIQYIERQVVLFDSIEDASFEQMNDLRGKGSVAALLLRAETDGKREALRRSMDDFSIRVVLTAHPTQFYPGHLLAILTDLETAIRQNDLPQINLLLQQLGKTGFINNQKPTPFDEAVSLCWYLENIFYHAAPAIVYQLMRGLNITLEQWKNDRLITIGFWPGGDRDGNPFVTTPITLQVAQRLRHGIQRNYYQDVRQLKRRLTFEGVEVLVQKVERKLYGTLYGGGEVYKNALELNDDLHQIRQILIERHGGLFLDLLEQFILKVKIFGFHFTSLDIRQDGRKHESVLRAILAKNNKEKIVFDQPTDRKKLEALLKVSVEESSFSVEDPLMAETISSFKAIKVIQEQNGLQGCHRYVISNCQSALHIVQVYQLARWLVAENNVLPLDIVPLFESIEDLGHAQLIMEEIYQIPEYRRHLEQRGNKQTIMLGFSDGTKDGGYLRANWSIFRAKELLTEVSRKFGISALFFDGRGGPPARGGGNTHDFYASLGDSIENNEVQVTIQGQTISSNFGKVASCQYNLEQLLSAGLEGRVFGHPNQLSNEHKTLLDQLAEAGHRSYLNLKLDAKFVPYLEKVTPLPFFGDTNIGSRPVKRSGDSLKFEDLRAIPFVVSWAQMKQNIPGFYGVGSALKELKEKGRWTELQSLYKQSLFFRTLIGNSMMSLTKSFYPATAYLAQDKEFGEFWKKMFNEFELSIKMILDLSSMPELMENNPSIRESIKLREKIVLPLITVQQFALMALRNSTDKTNEQTYRKLIVRCMFGIINAARNSA